MKIILIKYANDTIGEHQEKNQTQSGRKDRK
jgi:hypothetical protein